MRYCRLITTNIEYWFVAAINIEYTYWLRLAICWKILTLSIVDMTFNRLDNSERVDKSGSWSDKVSELG